MKLGARERVRQRWIFHYRLPCMKDYQLRDTINSCHLSFAPLPIPYICNLPCLIRICVNEAQQSQDVIFSLYSEVFLCNFNPSAEAFFSLTGAMYLVLLIYSQVILPL